MSVAQETTIKRAMNGHSRRDIARDLNISVNTVYHYVALARKMGAEFPPIATGPDPTAWKFVRVSSRIMERLEKRAAEFGQSAEDLAMDLIDKTVSDDLIEAVLDRSPARLQPLDSAQIDLIDYINNQG